MSPLAHCRPNAVPCTGHSRRPSCECRYQGATPRQSGRFGAPLPKGSPVSVAGRGRGKTLRKVKCTLTEPPEPKQKERAQGGTLLDKLSNAFTELLSSGSASGMPIAKGNLSDLIGAPLFYFLFDSFRTYGSVYKLEFGPKAFVVVSDPVVARHILKDNAFAYDKGVLAEILEPIMGKGLIPADLDTWKTRRRAIVPAFHSAYLDAMVNTFSRCAQQSVAKIDGLLRDAQGEGAQGHSPAHARVEMESEYSSLALDIIGLAVFNFDFGSVTSESPVIKAVYGTLAEAEHRSTFYLPYWNIPGASFVVPRQRKFQADLKYINECLDELIAKALATKQEDDLEALQQRDYSKVKDASVLRFLVDMRGEDCSGRQLRDDLMTMLIAGHETTAAVLTWATYMLAQDLPLQRRAQEEIDSVLGQRDTLTLDDIKQLRLVRYIVTEALRMFPQPPLLIRRSLEPDTWPAGLSGSATGFEIGKGTDVFIAIWNIHRSPELWEQPDKFNPDRFLKANPGQPEKGWEGYDPERAQSSLYPNEVAADFALLPFGGGPRKCVGDQFALMESTVGLALLLQKYDFALAGTPEDVQLVTGATIHTKDGLWCNVSRRGDGAQEKAAVASATSAV